MTAKTILVVDDEPNVREILVQRLRQRNFEVEAAATGDAALTQLAMRDYDFVLLDLMMPSMSGPSVLKAIQALPHKPRVIIVSAMAAVWKSHHAELDDVDVFEKPVDFPRLLALLGG